MEPRQRVIRTLNYQETDIIPYSLDLTDEVHARLVDYYGDEDFYHKTGTHLAQERNESFRTVNETDFYDMFGVLWSKEQQGDFGIVKESIFKSPQLGNYTFPEPDYELIAQKCIRLEAQPGKFRMYIIGFSLYERAWTMRGIPEILMDFLTEKAFANKLLDKIAEYNLRVIDEVAKYDVDCIFFGDDWGQQKGLIMGEKIWREFIKPRLKQQYDYVKSKGMYVAQHSCGDVSDVFGDLVDIGMDIYNTFQPEIYDVEEMKRQYGQDVTFYGGVSTQQVLPFGTCDEVREQTRYLINVVGKNGGYICAPTHSIPSDVPTENIIAFLDTVQNQ